MGEVLTALRRSVHIERQEWANIGMVKRHFGVCEMTIYRWVKDDGLGFPQPRYINGRRYWKWREIEAWSEARVLPRA